jgi:GPH family glycoside/pentoside/hexuronide:cation symporter
VVEDTAVKTGVRSEGLLFAANGLLPKITSGLGVLVGNFMLELARFPAAAQTGAVTAVDPAIMRHLALLSLPAGAVLNLVAIAVLVFYRLDRRGHEANLEALRLAAAVTEPPALVLGAGPPIPAPGSIAPPI